MDLSKRHLDPTTFGAAYARIVLGIYPQILVVVQEDAEEQLAIIVLSSLAWNTTVSIGWTYW